MILLEKSFTKDLYKARFRAQEEEDGLRLDQFVMLRFENWSRQIIKKKIDASEIFIETREGKQRPSSKVRNHDIVQVTTPFKAEDGETWKGEVLKLENELPIVHQEKDYIVVTKPAFMATHPTGKHLFHCVTVYLEAELNMPVQSVHRIDRETSGILVLGKNSKKAMEITKFFEHSQVKKAYFFIGKNVENKELPNEALNKNRLGTEEEGLKRVYIESYPEDDSRGKHAETHFKIIEKIGDIVIGLAFPKTGRQHQIRVHAKDLGYPLIGDKLYLGSYPMFQRFKDGYAEPEDFEAMILPRHALHAIGIRVPFKDQPKTFISTIPKDLLEYLGTLMDKKSLDQLREQIQMTIKETLA
ncbi:MAG: pseudouridine synthase [Bacteriovoracaceae bacterium]